MNLPNMLTLGRIFLVPLLIAILLQDGWHVEAFAHRVSHYWLALVIFMAAACTDMVDGYLARRWKQVTTVGTLLDPIADKLLVSAALIVLVQIQAAPAWVVILIIGREFAVSGLRSIAAAEGYTIQASDIGKTKMFSQVIAVALLILSQEYPSLREIALISLFGVVVFAIWSAVDYFYKFWRALDERVKLRRRKELLALERRRNKEARRAARKPVTL